MNQHPVRKQGRERGKKNKSPVYRSVTLHPDSVEYRLPAVSISRPCRVRSHETVTDTVLALRFALFKEKKPVGRYC